MVTSLSPHALRTLARRHAEDLGASGCPLRFDPHERWSSRLWADDTVDLWLLTWTQDQSTELHDHGGSAGAFHVVTGELEEVLADGRRRRLMAGSGVGFGPSHVHDVANRGPLPAVSVHAYSPPLSQMSYYERDATGLLLRTVTVATTHPEPMQLAG